MSTTRREFTKLLGVSAVATAASTSPSAGLSLWDRAELEVQQVGQVSAEVTRMLLDLHGPHGIFDEPEFFEQLRASLTRKVRDHAVIRKFEIPADLEPANSFRR